MKIFTTVMLIASIAILVHSVFSFLALRTELKGTLYCSRFEEQSISVLYLVLLILFIPAYILFTLYWIHLQTYEKALLMVMALLVAGSVFVLISTVFLKRFIESVIGLKRNQTDTMTGLLSKEGIELAARKQLLEGTGQDTMVILDLDHFKQVNDELGHDKGDEVIRMVASVIQSAVRSEDLIGRFGGDEYILILRNVDEVNAKIVLTRIQFGVDQRLAEDGITMCSGISYGMSPLIGGSQEAYETVFKRADQHLYAMKEARKRAED